MVCLVSDTFSDAVRRGFYSTADQLLLSLVQSDVVRRVLVVDHPRGVLSQVNRRRKGDRPAPTSGKIRGVRPLTITTASPTDVDQVTRRYRAVDRQIQLAIARHRLHDPFVITFNLFHAAFGAQNLTFDGAFYAQDDESAIPRLAAHYPTIRRAYKQVASRWPNIVAVSSELSQRIGGSGVQLVIPNGVDPALWAHAGRGPASTEIADLKRQGRPQAVYAGTIDGRLDIAALRQLHDAGFDIVLAGPVADQSLKPRLEFARLVGNLSRTDVRSLLVNADLCVLPHVSTRLTEAMSPLKLFEYVASGTPVVATDLAGVREGWPAGNLVKPHGDYVAAAGAALQAGRLGEPDRAAVVRRFSWRTRHEPLLTLLQSSR